MSIRFVAILAFFLPFVLTPAAAASCRLETNLAAVLRHQEHPRAAGYDGGAVEYCGDHPATAWLFDAPRKTDHGLCSIRQDTIGLRWDRQGAFEPKGDPVMAHSEPVYFVQPSSGACPPPGDAGYVRTVDVPDGVFLELYRIWTKARASRETFRALLSTLPATDHASAASLEAALFDPRSGSHLRLDFIRPVSGTFFRDGDRSKGVAAYALKIEDDRDLGAWTEIYVDWTPAGFVAVGMAEEAI